jgi:SHS2 domain-containing protein
MWYRIKMPKYKILEHTADFKIKAFGKTRKELFRNAMLAMEQILRPEIKNQKPETKNKIKVESENLKSLLVDFLNEINYQNETNLEIYDKIVFDNFSDILIEAELFGKKVKRFGLQVKGATFHDLDIHQKKDGAWEATVLFDI